MVPNNLAPHMTHANDVMLLRRTYWQWMPEVIAIDTRDGQNPSNFWPLPPSQFAQLQSRLAVDPNYSVTKVTDQQLIYHKKSEVNLAWYSQFAIDSPRVNLEAN